MAQKSNDAADTATVEPVKFVRVLIEGDCFIPTLKGAPRLLVRDDEVEIELGMAVDLVRAGRALFLDADDVPDAMRPALRTVTVSAVFKAAALARRRARAAAA